MKIFVRLIGFTLIILLLTWAARNGHLPPEIVTVAGVLAIVILSVLVLFILLFKLPLWLSFLAFIGLAVGLTYLLEQYSFSVYRPAEVQGGSMGSEEFDQPKPQTIPKLFEPQKR